VSNTGMTQTQTTNESGTMKRVTIQQAAAILIDRGMTFEPQQPILVDGKFVAQYRVAGEILTAAEVNAIL